MSWRTLCSLVLMLACLGWGGRSDDPTLPAFPEAEGPAAITQGPRSDLANAQTLVVDSLGDDESDGCGVGECQLREAANTAGCRYVHFNVVGNIGLQSRFQITEDCMYLSGASAPGLLTVNNYPIELVDVEQVIVRDIKARVIHSGTDEAQGLFGGPNCNAVVARCEDASGSASATACTDENDDGAGGSCAGIGPEDCKWWIASETELSNCNEVGGGGTSACSECGACNGFALHVDRNGTQSAAETLAGQRCMDTRLANSGITDGFSIRGASRYVIVEGVSVSHSADETFPISLDPGADYISVQGNMVANGVRADPANQIYGQREDNHHLGPLMALVPKAKVSSHKNVLMHNWRRTPRLTEGWLQWKANLAYNFGQTVYSGFGGGTIGQCASDVVANLWRHGPMWAPTQGGWNPKYCVGDSDDGRACRTDSDCAGAGTCTDEHQGYFLIGGVFGQRHSAYLSGNEFLNATGTVVTDSLPGGGEFGTQWDRVATIGDPGRPTRSDDPMAGTAYEARRTQPLYQNLRFPVTLPDPLTLDDSPNGLLYTAGANQPCRDSFDRALIDSYENGTGYIAPPSGGRVLPSPPDPAATWPDTDADGLADGWETTHFGALTQGPKDDPDGDGYPNIEEWYGGYDPNSAVNVDTRSIVACAEDTP